MGSDLEGNRLAQGQFEELYTFSRACPAEEMAWNYEVQAKRTTLGPITEEEQRARLEAVAKAASSSQSKTGGTGLMPPGMGVESFQCSLWVGIGWSTAPDEIIVTVHNTLPGETYRLWSKPDLNLTTWTLEQTLVGSSGQNWTETPVLMQGRPALFFLAEGPAEFRVETGFAGLTLEDTDWDPPDTMGAVGPDHFVELLNGTIVVYAKSGQLMEGPLSSKAFFQVGAYPTGVAVFDPRIVYDHQSNRWVACSLDAFGTEDVMLAVSVRIL